jgi:hypothetical protein
VVQRICKMTALAKCMCAIICNGHTTPQERVWYGTHGVGRRMKAARKKRKQQKTHTSPRSSCRGKSNRVCLVVSVCNNTRWGEGFLCVAKRDRRGVLLPLPPPQYQTYSCESTSLTAHTPCFSVATPLHKGTVQALCITDDDSQRQKGKNKLVHC